MAKNAWRVRVTGHDGPILPPAALELPTARVLAIHGNDVAEKHAYAVLAHLGEDLPGFDGCRLALWQIRPRESYLLVRYLPEPESDSLFVLTARRLRGDVLRARRAPPRTKRLTAPSETWKNRFTETTRG